MSRGFAGVGWTMHVGDVEETLLSFEPNSFSACLADPPYGLRFMNQSWDYDVPSVHVWRALLRCMKPGAALLSFGGSRTSHRLACAIEDAGFELRDTLMYMYGTGFPKSQNAALKSGATWKGYGTALKPAFEPIVLARKPLDGTMENNVAKHGCGPLAIDASRVATDWSDRSEAWKRSGHSAKPDAEKIAAPPGIGIECHPLGRWPSNVIMDDVAAQALDEQTGDLGKSMGGKNSAGRRGAGFRHAGKEPVEHPGFGDRGGASRFFYVAKASRSEREAGCEQLELVDAHDVVHRKEDTAGLNSPRAGAGRTSARRNTHPTVKPIALNEYLARLVLPATGGRILVPYAGVASEMIGALRAGWSDVVGIEREEDYVRIAQARLNHWAPKAKEVA